VFLSKLLNVCQMIRYYHVYFETTDTWVNELQEIISSSPRSSRNSRLDGLYDEIYNNFLNSFIQFDSSFMTSGLTILSLLAMYLVYFLFSSHSYSLSRGDIEDTTIISASVFISSLFWISKFSDNFIIFEKFVILFFLQISILIYYFKFYPNNNKQLSSYLSLVSILACPYLICHLFQDSSSSPNFSFFPFLLGQYTQHQTNLPLALIGFTMLYHSSLHLLRFPTFNSHYQILVMDVLILFIYQAFLKSIVHLPLYLMIMFVGQIIYLISNYPPSFHRSTLIMIIFQHFLILVTSPLLSPLLSLFNYLLSSLIHIIKPKETSKDSQIYLLSLIILLTGKLVYIGSTHSFHIISTLHLESALIGVGEFSMVWNAVMLVFNTGGYRILSEMAILEVLLPLLFQKDEKRLRSLQESWSLKILLFQLLALLFLMISNFVLRDHLMVWSTFAPRLLFEIGLFGLSLIRYLLFELAVSDRQETNKVE